MDMGYNTSYYCDWRVRRSIVETESAGEWQEFHFLDEPTPTTGIIMSAAPAAGLNLACLEHYRWVNGYVL
jgi:hypothetical protein